MYKRVIFGPVVNIKVETLNDLTFPEISAYVLLAVMVIGMGVYPKPWLTYVHHTVSHTLLLANQSKG